MVHLFAGQDFYPRGGVKDHLGSYASAAEAIRDVANMNAIDWWQVVQFADDGEVMLLDSGKRS